MTSFLKPFHKEEEKCTEMEIGMAEKKILEDSHIETLEELLRNMKFGSITIIVQDGKIIQIDKTEKHRM